MPRQIPPDVDDPNARFTEELENLVMEARNAGVTDAEITQMLTDEVEAIENNDTFADLFN